VAGVEGIPGRRGREVEVELPLLAALSVEDRTAVLGKMRRRRFERGAYVFHAGEAGDCLHVIVKGRVAVLSGEGGDPVTLAILGVGDVVGEHALLGEEPVRTATIRAIEPTETLQLRRAQFEELRRREPSVEQFLVTVLTDQVRRLTRQVSELVNVPAPTRIHRGILELGHVFDVVDTDRHIPVTQDQIASMAGVRLRVTNRVLAASREAGVLATGQRRVRVLRWDELRRLARPNGR
jgi:CRP/FNR family transcriptional regulator, cyclic AMP receptor protein